MLANRVRMSRQLRDKFGAPILTEQGMFLDRWTASGTGTGVGQVYDNMLYLSVDSNASTGDSALFLSDPVKVSSDAFGWQMTNRVDLGGMTAYTNSAERHLHGIPIDMIIKIGITLTCPQAAKPPFVPAKFELYLSIMDEDGEPLVGWSLSTTISPPIVSIDWFKFT